MALSREKLDNIKKTTRHLLSFEGESFALDEEGIRSATLKTLRDEDFSATASSVSVISRTAIVRIISGSDRKTDRFTIPLEEVEEERQKWAEYNQSNRRPQILHQTMIDLKEGINNSFGFMRLRRALRGGPERTMIEREAIEVEAGEKAALREIVAEIDRELGAIPNQEKIRENLELLEENGPLGRWLNGIIRPYAEEQLAFWERHRK